VPSIKPCGSSHIAGQNPVPAGTLKQAVTSVLMPIVFPLLPLPSLEAEVIIRADV